MRTSTDQLANDGTVVNGFDYSLRQPAKYEFGVDRDGASESRISWDGPFDSVSCWRAFFDIPKGEA